MFTVEPPINSQNDRVYAPVGNKSDTSIPADCYTCWLWRKLPCHKWVWLKRYLSTMGWRWTASITAMSCCLSRCFQQSNVSQNIVYSQNNMLLTAKLVIFLCSVISQGKVVALDRWGGKWNHLSMTHRLAINYAKNYCNRTPIVKVIVENVVTCFLGTQCIWYLFPLRRCCRTLATKKPSTSAVTALAKMPSTQISTSILVAK